MRMRVSKVKQAMIREKDRGFTLIEIMIVIAIIAIIVSIASYQYGKIKKRVTEKACMANMKRIYDAAQEYLIYYPVPDTQHGLDVGELIKKGLLKRRPRCPIKNNFYTITYEKKGRVVITCKGRPPNTSSGHGRFKYGDSPK